MLNRSVSGLWGRRLATCALLSLLASPGFAAPAASGLDLNNLDRTASASQDFFQYANGGWLKSHPIPSDKPRWGTFNQLYENNLEKLHAILESQAAHPDDENGRKLGDFYASGMDPAALAAGLESVRAEWQAIAAASGASGLQACVEQLHARGVRPYFSFGSAQDAKNSSLVIGQLNQGGLGLPDRDYYTRDDEKSKRLREQYQVLMKDAFTRWGLPAAEAESATRDVFALETRLAKSSLTLVEQRDPAATYHPVSPSELATKAGGFDWGHYFAALHTPEMSQINLAMPVFFAELGKTLSETSPEVQKRYLQWTLLRSSAESLSEEWATLFYDFYGKALTGAQSMPPRWRRVVPKVDGEMGDALGAKYVALYFPPAAKAKVQDMVTRLRSALSQTLNELEWMSPATKTAAQAKLTSFRAKIGYPDSWRDYSALSISRSNFLANVWAGSAFEVRRDLAKIGKPVDRNEWFMTPPTVNAYYDPQNNEIVFPAGILQPPFFSLEADDAVNYGALGVVIGHEITHGFDDQGAQYDPQGNLRDWWTADDLAKFKTRSQAIIDQFSGYEVSPGLRINGKLVVGESIADLGGLKLALNAYHESQKGKPAETLDGFTPDQRFFLGYARIWAMNMRPEYERLQVNTDPHPHPRFRVNGPLSNMSEFQRAFNVPADSPMVRKQRNQIW